MTVVAVQDELDVVAEVCDAVATDWRPSRRDARQAIRQAIHDTAAANRQLVHIADIRRRLPGTVPPALLGAYMNRLARRGYLAKTGRHRPNGDPSPDARNRTKPSPVWRLTRPIPMEETT